MDPHLVSPDQPAPLPLDAARTVPRRRRWHVLVRATWGTLAALALALALLVAAIAARFAQLNQPPASVRTDLAQLGLSVRLYALYTVALSALFAITCFVVGAVIAWRKPTDRMALLVSLFLLLLGPLFGPNAAVLEETYPAATVLINLGYAFVISAQVLMLFLFPNGRVVPRWSRLPLFVWLAGMLIFMLQPGDPLATGPGIVGGVMLLTGLVSGIVAQVYRYARVSTVVQRQQTKWVVFGVAAAAAGFLLLILPSAFIPALTQSGLTGLLYALVSDTGATIAALLIPVTLGIAILRHRLWDIDLVINRALVYGALTLCTVGLYLLVVGGLGALFPAQDNGLASLVAAALIAILFAPLRTRLQRAVNRLLYGDRDEPYVALSRLGQRIGIAVAPDAVLRTVVDTVREALRVPYVAITLHGEHRVSDREVESGRRGDELLQFPLVYQHERVGDLILAPRAPGEMLSAADRRLVDDLARQAGAAVHAVRLTADLQRSREQLVTAREEERRRLRRDLHDGLGPALAAQMLKVGFARSLIPSDPIKANAVLSELETDLETALTDIRRLVYSLRPPALDDLGLVAAIQATAAQYRTGQTEAGVSRRHAGLAVIVEAPHALAPLPAAVEVAAYRIVQEALTNVVRHAAATSCRVKLWVDDGCLSIEIIDDGVGLPTERRAGVGLASMRERAAELGGKFLIETPAGGGTRLLACLPLPVDQEPSPGSGQRPGLQAAGPLDQAAAR